MTEPRRRVLLRLISLSIVLTAACARNREPDMVADMPVRVAPPVGAVKYGDCKDAVRRALAKPDLEVDRLPAPRAFVPAPLPGKTMPAAVRKSRYSEVRITVLVDTLGRADMRTYTVVKSTHPWLASSARSAVAKWTFEPAELAGCKVPRIFKWGATKGTAPRA